MTVGGGELHTRLRIARECSGLTQAELAARAGFAVNTLKQYESGRIKPGADALAGYARSGINVTYLLLGEGSPLLARQGDYGTHQVTTALLVGEGRRRARWEVPLAQAAEAMREIVGFRNTWLGRRVAAHRRYRFESRNTWLQIVEHVSTLILTQQGRFGHTRRARFTRFAAHCPPRRDP